MVRFFAVERVSCWAVGLLGSLAGECFGLGLLSFLAVELLGCLAKGFAYSGSP